MSQTLTEIAQQLRASNKKGQLIYAFTEGLFYWDNDLAEDATPKLKIQPNSFTDWVLKEQGQDQNVITNFQKYADDKLTSRYTLSNEEIAEPTAAEKKLVNHLLGNLNKHGYWKQEEPNG